MQFAGETKPFLAAGGSLGAKAFLREKSSEGLSGGRVVFDNQDGIAHRALPDEGWHGSRLRLFHLGRLRLSHRRRKRDGEGGANARLTLYRDIPAHRLAELAGDRETQPGA